jgi:hypothetical protein
MMLATRLAVSCAMARLTIGSWFFTASPTCFDISAAIAQSASYGPNHLDA